MPQRAVPVRPRVTVQGGSEAIPIDALLDQLPTQSGDVLAILGERGSGKSTCLRFLDGALPYDSRLALLDEPDDQQIMHAAAFGPVVYTASSAAPGEPAWHLAEWDRDDLIEYTLAVDAQKANSVLARALPLYERDPVDGSPAVWSAVLDAFIEDPEARDLTAVMDNALRGLDDGARAQFERRCFGAVIADVPVPTKGLPERAARLVHNQGVRQTVAANFAAGRLHTSDGPRLLSRRWPRGLVNACAQGLPDQARRSLVSILDQVRLAQPMAASLLHAAGAKLQFGSIPLLEGAYLDGLNAPGAKLATVLANRASLAHSDLSEARLAGASFVAADLFRTNLSRSVLHDAVFTSAVLAGADLSWAEAKEAVFNPATLDGANLTSLRASKARFLSASMRGCRLVRADLRQTDFFRCDLEDANASGAVFDESHLQYLDLRTVVLAGASFVETLFDHCDLSGQDLQAPDFERAVLEQCDLTGSVMTNANFAGCLFPGAGLAEVHWEYADLRGSDLRGATFHMGSSRSGLVFSPIACEGSRTGFYTEDIEDLTHKAPEEIRKANLRGADLRGCLLDGVDFYLVDLRDARYDPKVEPWLRKTGAILEDPT
jgi:uncharacterized protein YjbI with pentapeptide repeats